MLSACAKTKAQISCAVTVQLINSFVYTTWIVQNVYQSLALFNKFQKESDVCPFTYTGRKGSAEAIDLALQGPCYWSRGLRKHVIGIYENKDTDQLHG